MADKNPEHIREAEERSGDSENDQLIKQTSGLDVDVTSKIAGPDWDPELVEEAEESMPGETLQGEVERGDSGDGGR